jgi:hypothetical protein
MNDPTIENEVDLEAPTPDVTAPTEPVAAAPTAVNVRTLPFDLLKRVRVIDASTGEPIERVIEADSEAGTVKRFAVENGNLVREDDHFKVIEEQRPIRIEIADE